MSGVPHESARPAVSAPGRSEAEGFLDGSPPPVGPVRDLDLPRSTRPTSSGPGVADVADAAPPGAYRLDAREARRVAGLSRRFELGDVDGERDLVAESHVLIERLYL
jgi:hypothetical protein